MNVLPARVSAPCACLMPLKVRKCHGLWNWTCRSSESPCGCWEMSPVLCKSSYLSSSVVVFKYMISPVIFLSYPPFLTSCFCGDKKLHNSAFWREHYCVRTQFILSAQYMKELCILRQQCVYPVSAMSWVTTSACPAVAAQLWSTTV